MSCRTFHVAWLAHPLAGDCCITCNDDPALTPSLIDGWRTEIRRINKLKKTQTVTITFFHELEDEERYELTEAGKAMMAARRGK